MADSNIEHPASSTEHPASGNQISTQDVIDAVDRERLAREVMQLLKEELRIQRDRLGHGRS